MRKVKIPTSMNPFVVHVNGEKYVYPAGTEQEVTDAVANVIDAYIKKENQQPDPTESPFSTSWNDLKDKPFGEETVTVNEPLNITWDGNTEGLVCVADTFYKVSDATPTSGELANGGSYAIKSTTALSYEESGAFSADDFIDYGGLTFITPGGKMLATVVPESMVGVDVDGLIFHEKGLYFAFSPVVDDLFYLSSLTTTEPVEQTKTVVKTLDEKYMPILTSPSGKKFKLSVDDSGVLSATEVTE